MNTDTIIELLKTTKKFVTHNANDTSPENAEEIQSLLSACIEAAQIDDSEEVRNLLSQVSAISPAIWDLTSAVSKELNNN